MNIADLAARSRSCLGPTKWWSEVKADVERETKERNAKTNTHYDLTKEVARDVKSLQESHKALALLVEAMINERGVNNET